MWQRSTGPMKHGQIRAYTSTYSLKQSPVSGPVMERVHVRLRIREMVYKLCTATFTGAREGIVSAGVLLARFRIALDWVEVHGRLSSTWRLEWYQEHQHPPCVGRTAGQTDCRIERPYHSHCDLPLSWRRRHGMAGDLRRGCQPLVRIGVEVTGSAGAHRAAKHRCRCLDPHRPGG